MRWSWRADLPPFILDALLEGSLVGVAYAALEIMGTRTGAPLSLVEFWIAAAAGLALVRLRPRKLGRALWIAAPAVFAGALGWLSDPAAYATLTVLKDPLDAFFLNPAGWLLGVAVLRGGVHEETHDEIEVSTRALGYAFPVLAVAWLLHLRAGGAFIGTALVGSTVCVGAGLLAVGFARLRELELLGSDSRVASAWPRIAAGVVVAIAAVAIPIALLSGSSGRDILAALGGPVDGALGGALARLLAPLASLGDSLSAAIGHFLSGIHLPSLFGSGGSEPIRAIPTDNPATESGGSQGTSSVGGSGLSLPLGWLVPAVAVAVVLLAAIRLRRMAAAGPARRVGAPPREERRTEVHAPRWNLHLPAAALHPHVPLRRRPASAAEAYLALLDELAGRGELGWRTAETPQAHAARGGALGLPRRPLGLLAADYELAVYGRVTLADGETARAIGRWRRLRRAAQGLQRRGAPR
jgi:hypothetical protein